MILVCTNSTICYCNIILKSFISDTVAISDIKNLNIFKKLHSTQLDLLNLANQIKNFKNQYPDVWDIKPNIYRTRTVECFEDNGIEFCYFDLHDASKLLKDFISLYVIINKQNKALDFDQLNGFENYLKIKVLWTYQRSYTLNEFNNLKKLENNDYKVSDQNKVNLPRSSAIIFGIYKDKFKDVKNDFPIFI